MAIFDTAATIISQAARELSLVSADITNPYASTNDPNILLLTSLLTSAGKDIIREHNWSQSLLLKTFTTGAGTSTYDPPADFIRMVNQTGWNRTSRFPLGGPLSPQEWEFITATGNGITTRLLFRFRNRKMEFVNGASTPGSQTVAYWYMSSYWVQATGETAGNKAKPTAATDTILFDSHLMVQALKLKYREEKGFDTTAAQRNYDRALAAVMRDDQPAPVLSLNGGDSSERMLDGCNLPDTGYGG